jgi:hypothetical protein
MPYQVLDEDGRAMDAHIDLDPLGIVFHSRGGSRGRGDVRNQEYGPALRLVLQRIADAQVQIAGAWVDSSRVQALPIAERTILTSNEMSGDASEAFRLMSSRMKEIGRSEEGSGGNPTKRIRIQLSGPRTLAELERLLRLKRVEADFRSSERLPSDELHKVTAEHIWRAVQALRENPSQHGFGSSTDFDLLTSAGDRLPPKAVFGLAASEALGFEVQPKHFTGGLGTVCFNLLEDAGYEIVPKGADARTIGVPISQEDREWSEGRPKLVAHLRRERASGLAQAKKNSFKRAHGQLRCERCGLDPVSVYGGLHGEACIEVHHSATPVQDMAETHVTKLEDLECLCANCHRVEHRLFKQNLISVS